MSNSKYSLLLLRNQSIKDEESDYDLKLYKTKSKYKYNNFEKFRPKTKVNSDDNENVLKGAENQVKSLLSNFIKNFQSEKNNSDILYKQINTFKNTNDLEQPNSSKKKPITKIRTITYKKYKRGNSYIFNNHLIGNKFIDNNIANTGYSPKKRFSYKNIPNVFFSVSPRHKKKKIDSQKIGINHHLFNHKSPNQKFKDDILQNIPTLNFENTNNINNRYNKRFASGKNIKLLNKNLSSNKKNELNVNSLIKKTQTQNHIKNYLNFKNDEYISNNNDYSKKRTSIQFPSLKNIVNSIKNNIKQINKNKIIKKDSNKNHKINKLQTDDYINDEINIQSDKLKRCLSPKSKKSSLFRKQQLMIFGEKNDVDSSSQNKEIFSKGTKKLKKWGKNIKRAETSKANYKNNQNEDKIKFLKLISNFKSLKHKIKQNIILRPEDQEQNKNFKKFSSKKKLLTSDKIINFKQIIEEEQPKSNREITHSNTVVFQGEHKEEIEKDENEISKDKLDKDIKPKIEIKETKKSESYNEDYSFHSIQRKKVLHIEKYRMLSHKGVIYDSLDDEELEDEEEINGCYIDPNSTFCFCFDLILFFITIITFIEMPLYLAMSTNFCKPKKFSFNDTINVISECMNMLDFFFGFFRAYYNWEEQLIKKNDKIAKKYLFGWCLFDVISAIPLYSLFKISEETCDDNKNALYYNVLLDNLHYLLMCNRLFKLLKIFSKNQAWKYISNKLNEFWSLIFSICLILMALNYTACLYIFIARNSYPNWILRAKLEIAEFHNLYICAIYILLMALTTVGYGDITCYSFHERIFQIFLLIIGIIAYSWVVSSFSNFIQKLNEKSADYEKKKSIIDEIRINNPNLPDELYDRIIRYLKFRHFHEKNLKNIIFDCLPVGLKNNLIYEMYKPVIKNFIFFKNFQNTDFIVQVILSFKPILAYKNYILVNEGELIEEIMFVRHGVLSVELPINITNPQENIEKYLKETITKDKEKSLLNTSSKIKNDTFSSFLGENPKKLLSLGNTSTINSSLNYKSSFLHNNTSLNKAKTVKIQKAYVRILGIRENEHFGDVLMFLEERSPLRVRVRSKKCELFFLRKIDALKISASYPNIWRRINKKSVYNFKQIEKNIKKIVEIYCSVKKVNEKNSEGNMLGGEFELKKTGVWVHPNNIDLNNSALNTTYKKINDKQNKSEGEAQLRVKTKNLFFHNNEINDNYFNDSNIKKQSATVKRNHSVKIVKTKLNSLFYPDEEILISPFSFSDTSSSELAQQQQKVTKKVKKNNNNTRTKKKKLTKKLLDVFNHNYMYYKGINKPNIDDYPITIIAEETDKECSLNPMLNNTNNINNNSVYKNLINSKTKMIEYESIKERNEENKLNNKNKQNKNKTMQSLFGISKIKIDNYGNVKNKEILINSSEDNSSDDNYYENNKINNEIYPGELINITSVENLLDKKIDYNTDYKIENNFNINSNIEHNNRNRDLDKLLKYFDEESRSIQNNKSIKSIKASSHFKSSKNINSSNKLIFNHENDSSAVISRNGVSSLNLKTNWDNNILSINSDIKLEINSSYENYNLISGEKLIKSKVLQNKVKEYIIKESLNISNNELKNVDIKRSNSIEQKSKLQEDKKNRSILKDPSQKKRMASSIVYNTTNINYINSVSFMKNKPKKTIRKSSSLMNRNKSSIMIHPNEDKASNNFTLENKRQISQNKVDNKKFETEFVNGSSRNSVKFNNRLAKKKHTQTYIRSSMNIKHMDINHHKSFNLHDDTLSVKNNNYETTKEIPRRTKMKRRNSVLITNNFSRGKRKKEDNLLSLIDHNIQSTNQKLNEPEVFYNNYFNNILKEEKEKIKKKK